jgi:hypothetical protein
VRRGSRSGTFLSAPRRAGTSAAVSYPTRGDPTPHQGRIHQIQRSRRAGIGDFAAVSVQVVRRVETEISARCHANLVVWNHAENDRARGGAIAVDDDRLTRSAKAMIFVEVGSDPATPIIGNPDHWFELVRRRGS